MLKEERDDRRALAAISIQQASYSKLITKHDETKAELLLLTDLNFSSGRIVRVNKVTGAHLGCT